MRFAAFLTLVFSASCGGSMGGVGSLPSEGGAGASGAGGDTATAGAGGSAASGGGNAGGGAGAGGTPGSGGRIINPGVDAGTGMPDGGPGNDVDARPIPPAGSIPMFVAAGQGGRTITSCDDGKTWVGDHQYEVANTDTVTTYTNKGLAYGQGLFIVMMAWDGNVSLKVSEDGITWRRDLIKNGGYYGGIAWGGNTFAMIRNGNGGRQELAQYSRDLAKTWTPSRMQPAPGFLREGGGGGDLDVGVYGGGAGQTIMSWDRGETWTLSPCPSMDFGGVGQFGGIAFAGGNLVYVAQNGDFCRVSGGGKTSSNGRLTGFPSGGRLEGKLFWLGDKFWVSNGNHAWNSVDGAAWTRVPFQPTNTAIWAMAKSDTGTYVGVSGTNGKFYRSSDGINWQAATGPTGNPLWRVVFGYGKRSAMCP